MGTKITAMTALTAAETGDLLPVVDVSASATKKLTIADLFTAIPAARVYNSADFSCTAATSNYVTFNSERYDNGGLHSTSSNTSRLTAPIAGIYQFAASLYLTGTAGDIIFANVRLNRTDNICNGEIVLTAVTSDGAINMAGEYALAATDYLEVLVYPANNTTLAKNNSKQSPEFMMRWVRP